MAIVTISRGTLSGGRQLAETLARSLEYRLVTREDLSQKAADLGVPVERLLQAMSRPPRVYNQLWLERDQYLACVTMLLCESILSENVVYYGHSAHLLLCGVPNVLRIMVLAGTDFRVDSVMRTEGLSRSRAREYIEAVDTERDRWVRFLYDVDWRDPLNYDFVVHLDQVGWADAATGLSSVARSADFLLTEESRKVVRNLHLASKVRFALSQEESTSRAEVRVSAFDGFVQVVYHPRYAEVVPHAQELLARIPEVKEANISMARNSILYLQDHFDPHTASFGEVAAAAKKMDASLELLSFRRRGPRSGPQEVVDDENGRAVVESPPSERSTPVDETGPASCLHYLRDQGCSGSCSTFCGDDTAMLSRVRRERYNLVVLGELFTDQEPSSRLRKIDELHGFLTEQSRVPVVEARELEEQLSFGVGQAVKTVVAGLVAALTAYGVYFYSDDLISWLNLADAGDIRLLTVATVVLLTPLFAYAYGFFTGQLLRLLRLD